MVKRQNQLGVRNSNNAGGEAPEMRLKWNPLFDDTSRLFSPVIDADTSSELKLSFKHFNVYVFGSYELLVQTSTDDGTTWNTEWNVMVTGDIGPETIYIELDHLAGETFRIAWVFDGYTLYNDDWYIDDIIVEEN
ncbi:MAG: hypothetical protein KGY75_09800 [Candidatus Cloacimonetes bacterium]|nr:hypothetical protein [Candidatus Cloacimonadota bacterium]